MKKYLNDLGPKDIIENLKKGLSIESDDNSSKYFMIDNMICYLDVGGGLLINASLPCYKKEYYFKIEEPFEIKETGLYKTRNGMQVYISSLYYDCDRIKLYCSGVIKDEATINTWNTDGAFHNIKLKELDIVSKWNE